MKNPNCDNDKCTEANGETRVLPTGGDSNAILCFACYLHEMRFRRERNRDLAKENQFALPAWRDLKIYSAPARFYKTFKRSANNWKEFGSSRKITVETGLTEQQARERCDEFNKNRTPAQKRRGTMLEFTAQ